ncbi:unnamed protein product [Cylicostephanus goldi]|uniref:Uncharacterized protein n=1 Tax=Cylicostephanus goldi TaxID=71465 RepID=A0A3P6R359_CYLGO|nr:unnamed protein product [Cylicostephanus goldi]
MRTIPAFTPTTLTWMVLDDARRATVPPLTRQSYVPANIGANRGDTLLDEVNYCLCLVERKYSHGSIE